MKIKKFEVWPLEIMARLSRTVIIHQKWFELGTLRQTSRIKLEAGGHQEQLLSVHLKLVHDANASLILGGIKLSKF